MIGSFDLKSLLGRLRSAKFRSRNDPRFLVRIVLGVLLVANLVALVMLYRPWAPGPEELERRLRELRLAVQTKQASVERLRALTAKSEQAREKGSAFMHTYFTDPRTAYSTIISALEEVAGKASIRRGEHAYRSEPVEGSETISMMTITGDYVGTYQELVKMVNLLDRSPLFLILDTLTVAPEKDSDTLKVRLTINAFVSERPGQAPPGQNQERVGQVARPEMERREADG